MRRAAAPISSLIPSLILALASGPAQAHPQHEGGSALGASLAHLLSEPDHLAALLLPVVIAGVWLWRARSRARAAQRQRDARDTRR